MIKMKAPKALVDAVLTVPVEKRRDAIRFAEYLYFKYLEFNRQDGGLSLAECHDLAAAGAAVEVEFRYS